MEMHWTFQQEQTPPGGSRAGIPDDGKTGPDGGPKAAAAALLEEAPLEAQNIPAGRKSHPSGESSERLF